MIYSISECHKYLVSGIYKLLVIQTLVYNEFDKNNHFDILLYLLYLLL